MTRRARAARSERLLPLAFFAALACIAPRARAELPQLAPHEAAAHVGEHAAVCGVVDEASYRADVNGQPTFMNFGGRHPRQQFTALVWGEHRARFSPPPERHAGQRLCVVGRITSFRGKPQIVVDSPAQLERGMSP